MRLLLLLLLAALPLGAAPLAAQILAPPTSDPGAPASADSRVRTVDFIPDRVIVIEGAPGYQVTVELSPDEVVESVAVGDSGAWNVAANRKGDHLFIKAIMAGVSTNMTVITNVRVYNFELSPMMSASEIAYTVRFRYPPTVPEAEDDAPTAEGEGLYRLSGDKALRPSEMSDDGSHTYMRWPRDRSLPAVYAMSDAGQEMLVNGMMREDDLFVVDSVHKRLVFRIDDRVARAARQKPKRR
ncbi:MAG TPA: TrbG/VirB9 family P-type conjugative transfer protein [Allosphingosinicella sp.]|jgi:type IV secretion system protein VirB9